MSWIVKVVSIAVPVAFALAGIKSADAGTPSINGPAVEGVALVLDGDTIDISTPSGLRRIRLEGIDAPEGGQRCNLRWLSTWDCGRAAKLGLERLVRNKVVTCDDRGVDKYGRTLGVCMVDGQDINAAMVRSGLAWAFVRYSTIYTHEEATARSEQLGIWQAATMAPWDWRAQQKGRGRQEASPAAQEMRGGHVATAPLALLAGRHADVDLATTAPPGCSIKGNVTRNGRIYHTETSPWYARIRMQMGSGRRWFCSEAEAQDAGWRPVGLGSKSQ